MKKALRKFFTLIGFVVVMVSLIGYGIGFYKYEKSLHLPDKFVLTIDFTEPLVETAQSSPLDMVRGDSAGIEVAQVVRTLDRARRDGRVAGLVARFGATEPQLARAQEVRTALERFKASGKFTLAYAASFGELQPADKAFWLASQMDQVWVQPGGLVGLTGIGLDMPFFRGLLDQYGVKPDVLTRKGYKTAMANATDKGFTPQHREMLNGLLDTLYTQLVEGMAAGRKLDPATIKSLMDRGPLTAQQALDIKLIDRIAYEDEATAEAKTKAGLIDKKDEDSLVHWQDYSYVTDHRPAKEMPKTAPDDKVIALINLNGVIHQGESVEGPLGGFETAGADTIVGALDQALEDKSVKAIVLRVDSPGGSAVASETIRRAVMRADAAGKTVIVSMGATAASGGYWVATGAKTLIAEPATLTGSIGVVAGKFSVGELLKRFNVNVEYLQRGQNAAMWSAMRPFTEAQTAKLNELLDVTYGDFKQRVMDARGLDAATAEAVAQGRVWTGSEALSRKLVDELGGLDLAIRHAKEKIGVDPETPVNILALPQAPSRTEQLVNLLKNGIGSFAVLSQFSTILGGLSTELQPQGIVQMPNLRLH